MNGRVSEPELADDPLHVRDDLAPSVAESDAAAPTSEEAHPDGRFEARHRLAHLRRRDPHLARGAGNRAAAGDREERAHVSYRDPIAPLRHARGDS